MKFSIRGTRKIEKNLIKLDTGDINVPRIGEFDLRGTGEDTKLAIPLDFDDKSVP